MGKSSDQPNNQFRKPPPSLSTPGAHHMGGPDPEFGGGKPNGAAASKMGADPRSAAERKKAGAGDPTYAKIEGNPSADGTETETSVQDSSGPPRIPLEVDHFDRTMPELKRHWIIPGILIAITAILAVVIPVAVIMTREKEVVARPENTPAPLPVKANMTLEELQELVPGSSEAMLQTILEDKHSPQFLAVEWIKNDPYNWTDYEDWRKIQRYAMTVLFYSLDGASWGNDMRFKNFWASYHLDECEWKVSTKHDREPTCDNEKRFINFVAPNLEYLRGVLPVEMALMPHLQKIDFTGSNLGQDLDNLFSVLLAEDQDLTHFLPSLDTLTLTDTEMTGTIPPFLTSLPKLSHLDFSQNGMTSTIPSDLGLLTNLDTLILSGNDFTGTVPSELGALSLLSTFAIAETSLEQSPLPEAMCSEDHVTWIQLETDWCQSKELCCSA